MLKQALSVARPRSNSLRVSALLVVLEAGFERVGDVAQGAGLGGSGTFAID